MDALKESSELRLLRRSSEEVQSWAESYTGRDASEGESGQRSLAEQRSQIRLVKAKGRKAVGVTYKLPQAIEG